MQWHLSDGSDARVAVYPRSWVQTYFSEPFGTVSPDGLALMFSSNMGVNEGHVDVYLALMPETV